MCFTRLERLARDEHSSLLQKSVNYGRKKVYSTGPGVKKVVWGQSFELWLLYQKWSRLHFSGSFGSESFRPDLPFRAWIRRTPLENPMKRKSSSGLVTIGENYFLL